MSTTESPTAMRSGHTSRSQAGNLGEHTLRDVAGRRPTRDSTPLKADFAGDLIFRRASDSEPAQYIRDDGSVHALARAHQMLARNVAGGVVIHLADGVEVVDTTVPLWWLNGVHVTQIEPDQRKFEFALTLASATITDWSLQIIGRPPSYLEKAHAAARHMRATRPPLATRSLGAADLSETTDVYVVDTAGDRQRFLKALSVAYNVQPRVVTPLVSEQFLTLPAVTAYLARDADGVGATCLSVLDQSGWLGLFALTTVQHPRRGYLGEAIARRAISDGYSAGARRAYVQTAPTRNSMSEQLGFRRPADPWAYYRLVVT